jgi:hypothetical protein
MIVIDCKSPESLCPGEMHKSVDSLFLPPSKVTLGWIFFAQYKSPLSTARISDVSSPNRTKIMVM